MNKKVIIFVIAWLTLCSASYSQVVVTGSNGEAIIDCSGMKPSSYTTTKKPRTATDTGLADDLSSDLNNQKVYKRFEVSKKDEGPAIWSTAIILCARKSGGDWRLPTQRELMLMWVLKPELETLGFGPFKWQPYWSATKFDATGSWFLIFPEGKTGPSDVGYRGYVLCIRDL